MKFAVYVCRNDHDFAVLEHEEPIKCPICGQEEFEFSYEIAQPKELKLPEQKIKLSIFRESDQERASREIDCYGYLMVKALGHVAKAEFAKAAVYHENIVRSLKELQRLKDEKEYFDEAKDLIRKIHQKEKAVSCH